jgi:flagellar motor switch protein FliM
MTPHDFTKPTRLSADWRQRLSAWCKIAVSLANKASIRNLATPVEGLIQNLDVGYAKKVLGRVPDEMLAYRVRIGDRVQSILLLPRHLMLNLVGILLGETTAVASDRDLTLIEEKLADFYLLNHWLTFFRETWPGTAPLAWVLDERVPNLQASRMLQPEEVLVGIDFQLSGPWGKTAGAWYFAKKSLLDALGNAHHAADVVPEVQVAIRREAIVYQLPVQLEIVLGSAELRLTDLSSLQVGDVVLLDQRAADGVLARVGGQDVFRGQAGRLGSWKAFQVQANVKK